MTNRDNIVVKTNGSYERPREGGKKRKKTNLQEYTMVHIFSSSTSGTVKIPTFIGLSYNFVRTLAIYRKLFTTVVWKDIK